MCIRDSRYIREGARVIPGSSTIHFDEISKKRIYESIDKAKTSDMRLLRDSYRALKNKLGRIPTILEFKEHGAVDVIKIFEKCGSYHAFLKKYEPDYVCTLSNDEALIIEYMSKKLVSYKRIHELALLKHLICLLYTSHIHGNFHTFPQPIAQPADNIMKPIRLPSCSRFIINNPPPKCFLY